ncbi:MAG: cytochrome c family protein [Candidatus Thiodiazotropha sp. (ex Codakia rugifera)]|nr:cytochrome c family protein [Candidatus Thiodiazotropha sp. (ex Codakia rugifera)]
MLLFGGVSSSASEDFFSRHWQIPIPSQSGETPTPESCGQCHPKQLADWAQSQHAKAFSPGLVGQLMQYDSEETISCLACHAPLAIQQEQFLDGGEAAIERWLSDLESLSFSHGVFCVVCHLRQGRIFGPPTNVDTTSPSSSILTPNRYHSRSKRSPEFEDSRFCAPCHQFSQEILVNGKPLENTYREWLDSPYARDGTHCQSCHMRDRQHLFKGIHDQSFVEQSVSIDVAITDRKAILKLQSSGVGHRFPTYVVPRVTLKGGLIDGSGRPVQGSQREKIIQRQVRLESDGWEEVSDTRLYPGESVELIIPLFTGATEKKRVRFEVWVDPDYFYHFITYPRILEELPDGNSKNLVKRALIEARENRYLLFEREIESL